MNVLRREHCCWAQRLSRLKEAAVHKDSADGNNCGFTCTYLIRESQVGNEAQYMESGILYENILHPPLLEVSKNLDLIQEPSTSNRSGQAYVYHSRCPSITGEIRNTGIDSTAALSRATTTCALRSIVCPGRSGARFV